MSISATIETKDKAGNAVELFVEKSGPDKARLTARTWNVPKPTPGVAPTLTDTKLYGVKVSDDCNTITCRAEVTFDDPLVTMVIVAPIGAPKLITIRIEGTWFGLGDRVDTYALPDKDYDEIRAFLSAAQYPKL
jgi:hypothetical protein